VPRTTARRCAAAAMIALSVASCGRDIEMEFNTFVDAHVDTIEVLERDAALSWWDAAVSGSEDQYRRYAELRNDLDRVYAERGSFVFVSDVRASGKLKDPLMRRTADLLYLRYRGRQADPDLLERIAVLSAGIESRFNVFRPHVGGRTLAPGDVRRVLERSLDGDERRRVWEASKEVGPAVADDLLELARLRNESARQAGFEDYYVMSLELGEQDPAWIDALLTELDELTRGPFIELKRSIDAGIAERFGIGPGEIRPWHYADPFFQETPAADLPVLDGRLDRQAVIDLTARFYRSIGLPVDDILERSDLFEREGKCPHAFCTDIDRRGDIRILANVRGDRRWLETMLHECGHGAYDKYIGLDLPYLLRTYPHYAVTEAVAMFFGELVHDPAWLGRMLCLDPAQLAEMEPVLEAEARGRRLVFARWGLVMARFERELYRDPDQDLDRLWWDLVERFQDVRCPDGRSAPDWAAKIHIVSSPVYYHNYLLGEMIASQLRAALVGTEETGGGAYGNLALGEFFRERLFRAGDTIPWTALVEQVTGEPLSAARFAAETAGETR
jgi:peptidyl-dipeptidase A